MQIVIIERECVMTVCLNYIQYSNFLLMNKSNRQYYHSHYLCIICAALARLEV
jgi:hypothetical protein